MDEGYNTLEHDQMNSELQNVPGTETVVDLKEPIQLDNEDKSNADVNTADTVDFNDSTLTSVSTSLPVVNIEESDNTENLVIPSTVQENIQDSNSGSQLSEISSLSTNSSSSGDESKKKDSKWKRRKIKEKLDGTTKELTEANKKLEQLEFHLREEKDAKERLESQLLKLQGKYQEQLKDEETLRSQLNHKDEYCRSLECKVSSLEKEFKNLRTSENNSSGVDDTDGNDITGFDENDSNTSNTEDVVEKLKADLYETEEKLQSINVLVQTYLAQVEKLDSENIELKKRLSKFEQDFSNEESHEQNSPIDNLLERLNELQSNITLLENEKSDLQIALEKEQLKNSDETRASIEISSLQDRLQISEETNNENVIKNLRQEVLDIQLAFERSKQAHRDEIAKCKEVSKSIDKMEELKLESNASQKLLAETQNLLDSSQKVANERMQKIMELKTDIVSLNDTIKIMENKELEKAEEISSMEENLADHKEEISKLTAEKKAAEMNLAEMETFKDRCDSLQDELEDVNNKLKMKRMKAKFLKKQVAELEEQKQKTDSILFLLPEMQKKLNSVEEERNKLEEEINSWKQLELDRTQQLEKQKQEEEERLVRAKEEWERNLLGIGKCELYHEGDCQEETVQYSESFNRPNSAPLIKPRPPSARRVNGVNGQRRTFSGRAPTLNPEFLNSYPEGRRASEKMKRHQERIILSSKNRKNLYRSATEPATLLQSFNHSSGGKHFPKIPTNLEDKNHTPKVLVWGESEDGPSKKLVAVGDHVLARVRRDCSLHGKSTNEYTGFIKFIGFIEGNRNDVYIGLRLDDEVGNSDGRAQGRRYFRCEPRRGKFVCLDDIIKVLDSQTTKHMPIQAW